MKNIKVIKKDAVSKPDEQVKKVEENELQQKAKGRNVIKTIENWIAEWRIRSEIETLRALSELNNLKLKNSNGI
ncbi:MAG TPA: hypothetical protein VNB22_14245 [Pyrinomonadaceae bacterium]|jgi:hypothetical protein|nr:hypothetical protein [Pyrinomonadaceae bacterium]